MTSESRRPAPPIHARLRGIASPLAALALFALAVAVALPCGPAHAQGAPKTDDEKAFYAIGANQGMQLKSLGSVSNRELDLLIAGLRDMMEGTTPAVDLASTQPLVRSMVQSRQLAASIERGAAFAAEQKKVKGARVTDSGLIFISTKEGSGTSPSVTDLVRAHYHGTLPDGTVFDSTVQGPRKRDAPFEFRLSGVIPCWTEGIAMMKPGGKATLICPHTIAYGERAAGPIPPGSTLRFDVELVEVVKQSQ